MFRRLFILYVALRVYVSTKILQCRLNFTSTDPEKAWLTLHTQNAQLIHSAITHLEGLWIKAGQYLSSRPDVLPTPYVTYFSALQDALPEKPLADIKRMISEELGDVDVMFGAFEERSLATASIAQVHRAYLSSLPSLPDSPYNVVVKVQHKHVASKISADLKDLALLVRIIAFLEPLYDFTLILAEWVLEVPKELDFINEANNTIRVRDAVVAHNVSFASGHLMYVDVGFADPIMHLTTKRVMVMKYIQGFKILDKEAFVENEIDADTILKNIMKSFAYQIYTLGFWNGDCHAGNILVGKLNGTYTPILLDFGLTKQSTKEEQTVLSLILMSAKDLDYCGLLTNLQRLGLTFKVFEDPQRSMEIIQFLFRDTQTVSASKESRKAHFDKQREGRERKKEQRSESGTANAFPGILVFFGRVLDLLRGLCTTLGSEQNVMDLLVPFAKLHLASLTAGAELGLLKDVASADTLQSRVDAAAVGLIEKGKVLGIQVYAIVDGKMIVNTSGQYEPAPVLSSTLFPVFSCTKAITAAAMNILIQRNLISPSTLLADIWPEFISRAPESSQPHKRLISVQHILEHTSGLSTAGSDVMNDSENVLGICEISAMIARMEVAVPDAAPGGKVKYHALSYGWLCAGIVERVSGMSFIEFVNANVLSVVWGSSDFNGLGYIGIPDDISNDCLAEVVWDAAEMKMLGKSPPSVAKEMEVSQENVDTKDKPQPKPSTPETSSSVQQILEDAKKFNPFTSNPTYFNNAKVKRSIIPAASGNFSAHGLCKFYSHLITPSAQPLFTASTLTTFTNQDKPFLAGFHTYIFETPTGEYIRGFGHAGMGGSIALCIPCKGISVAVVLSRLSLVDSSVTKGLVNSVLHEYGLTWVSKQNVDMGVEKDNRSE